MPGRKSPYGIHVDSPDQRQWISFDSIGSIRRIASIVRGAAGSQRALKWRSPTLDPQRTHARRIAWRSGARTIRPRPSRTHVLDTERGLPAVGVHVTLYRLADDGKPIRMTQALTDDDGRVRDLLERPLTAGDYRLEFDLGRREAAFFTKDRASTCTSPTSARSYHVPLLLAPFSMTTYRGS